MKVTSPAVGGICQSKQGRDKGRYYLIVGIEQGGLIAVTDGNFKKLATPKKKNIKHLRLLPDKAETIALKFVKGKQVFDTEIYSALKNYNYPKPDGETVGNENKQA
ncbi:MAG: KOW domain-containing RNA-binding protein [Clostridia bacterium]|nr:KOW domain-containing RNA-binding protein [Clostridia bacterium]